MFGCNIHLNLDDNVCRLAWNMSYKKVSTAQNVEIVLYVEPMAGQISGIVANWKMHELLRPWTMNVLNSCTSCTLYASLAAIMCPLQLHICACIGSIGSLGVQHMKRQSLSHDYSQWGSPENSSLSDISLSWRHIASFPNVICQYTANTSPARHCPQLRVTSSWK